MRQGDASESLHVILKGSVRVERRDNQADEALVLAEFFPGDVVGEMGVLDGAPRSATVTAREPTETLALTAPLLSATLADYPSASSALVRTLTRRIRRTGELTERISRGEPASGAAADDGEARRGMALQTVSADFLENLKAAIRDT